MDSDSHTYMHLHILCGEYMLLLNSRCVIWKAELGRGCLSRPLKVASTWVRQKRALLHLSKGATAQSPAKSGIFSQVHKIYFPWWSLWVFFGFLFVCLSWLFVFVCLFIFLLQKFLWVSWDPVGTSSAHSINKHDLFLVRLCSNFSWYLPSGIQEFPFIRRGVK